MNEQRRRPVNLLRVLGLIVGSTGTWLIVLSSIIAHQRNAQVNRTSIAIGVFLTFLGATTGLILPRLYSTLTEYAQSKKIHPQQKSTTSFLLLAFGETCIEMAALLVMISLGIMIVAWDSQLSLSLLAWAFVLGWSGIDLIIFSSILSRSWLPPIATQGMECPKCGKSLNKAEHTVLVTMLGHDIPFCSNACARNFSKRLPLIRALRVIFRELNTILIFGGSAMWLVGLFTPYLKNMIGLGVGLHTLGLILWLVGRSVALKFW